MRGLIFAAMRPWFIPFPDPRGSIRTRFFVAVALSGPVWAAVQFGEVVARKALSASPLQVTLLTMIMPLANLTAIWWARLLVGRDQRPFMLAMGLLGSAAMISGLWMNTFSHLFLAFFLYYLAYAVYNTGQNRLLQQHIRIGSHGGVFGIANGIRMAAAALFSWLGGHWMDTVAGGYRHLYAVAGMITLFSTVIYATMPTKDDPAAARQGLNRTLLLGPLVEAWQLLKRRGDFVRYQIGFMLYGMAFIGMLPVVPLFLVDDLKLDYTTIGLAKGTIFQIVMIPSIAIFGKLYDRMTPHRMASRVFTALALYPLLLISSWYLPQYWRGLTVFAAFALFGAAMGGVSVLWSVSSVTFAGEEDAGVYQALHMAATAVRGTLAPLLALLVMQLFGKIAALSMAALFWIAAGVYMALLDRSDGAALQNRRFP